MKVENTRIINSLSCLNLIQDSKKMIDLLDRLFILKSVLDGTLSDSDSDDSIFLLSNEERKREYPVLWSVQEIVDLIKLIKNTQYKTYMFNHDILCRITEIAHRGGQEYMSESEALNAIREATKKFINK